MAPMRRAFSRLLLVALSLGGLFGAHGLAFSFAAPHVHDRAELLAETGHGSLLPVAIAVVTSLLLAFLRTSGSGWSQLAFLQLSGFVALEGAERIGAHGLQELFAEPVFYLGLVLQLVVSLLAIALVRVAKTVARLFSGPQSFVRGRTRPTFFSLPSIRFVSKVSAEAWNLRGPPLPLAF